jgi:hypothetical protein
MRCSARRYGQPANHEFRNRKMSGTPTVFDPSKSAAQQGLGLQVALATKMPSHLEPVLREHPRPPDVQHAPVVTAHEAGEQVMPKPRNFIPC